MGSDKLILVVEDDSTTRLAMKTLLEAAGYRVACASNGREALDHLRRAEPPWLILTDLSMPVMTGWQFRREQQQDPALSRIPVVVLSAEGDLPRIAAGLGVAGHLPKPVEFDGLLEAIRVLGEDLPTRLRDDRRWGRWPCPVPGQGGRRDGTRATCRRGGLGPDLALSVLDISRAGACLAVKAPLGKGQEVEVTLAGGGGQRPVRLLARVAWSAPAADGSRHVGLAFRTGLGDDDLRSLADC
jgi:CheY-like chemotaxis protein